MQVVVTYNLYTIIIGTTIANIHHLSFSKVYQYNVILLNTNLCKICSCKGNSPTLPCESATSMFTHCCITTEYHYLLHCSPLSCLLDVSQPHSEGKTNKQKKIHLYMPGNFIKIYSIPILRYIIL